MSVLEELAARTVNGHAQRIDGKAADPAMRLVAASPAESPPDADDLPGLTGPYQAASRVGNKPELMLTLRYKTGDEDDYAYSDLRWVEWKMPTTPQGRPALVLHFVGLAVAIIEGRNLYEIRRGIRRHRLSWLWELPEGRDFLPDDATVITRIQCLPPTGAGE